MMFNATPYEQAKARLATEHSHKKMAGIWFLPLLTRCDCCGKRRTTSTGKIKKSGKFVCHGRDYSLSELSAMTGIEKSSVSGRINELKKLGQVVESRKRSCHVTGKTVTAVKKAVQ